MTSAGLFSASTDRHQPARPHRSSAVIGATLTVVSLAACQSTPPLAYTSATSADESSKRVSACGYSVGFHERSVAITDAAHSLLEQAASEARRRKTAKVVVSAHYARIEGGALQDQRARAIADDLQRLGFAASEISVGHTYDLPPERPTGYVFVCDTVKDEKELLKTPPHDPDEKAPYKIGAVELRIPLRYLSAYDWRDTPIEPRDWGKVDLYFVWPGLKDRLSDVTQQCTRFDLNSCADLMLVDVTPTGRRSNSLLGRMPNKSELIPIRGQLYDGSWFVYKNWPQRAEALLQPEEQGDSPSVVSCSGYGANSPVAGGWQPTLEGVRALIASSPSYCRMVFAMTPTLDADVKFNGKNIADWRAIRTELRALVPRWQTPTSSNPTTQTKPL